MTSPVSPSETIAKAESVYVFRDANYQRRWTDKPKVGATEYVCAADYNALALQLEAMQRRAEDAEALAERLKLEAQSHAMEARTANSTINEIYQVVSGGNGEPGNWHGATPVREKLEAMQREMAEKDSALNAALVAMRIASALPGVSAEYDFSEAIRAASTARSPKSGEKS